MAHKRGETNNGTRQGNGAQRWFSKNVAKRRRRNAIAKQSRRRNRS